MKFEYLLCLLCFVNGVICAPLDKSSSTMLDQIIKQCPPKHTKVLSESKDQIYSRCSDWAAITNINKNVIDATQLQCLLYYEAFIGYCNKSEEINTTVSRELYVKYNLKEVCDFAKKSKMLATLLSVEGNCEKMCGDPFVSVNPFCSLAYHFAHLNVSVPTTAKTDTDTSDNTKPEKTQNVNNQKNNAEPSNDTPLKQKGTNDVKDNASQEKSNKPHMVKVAANVPNPPSQSQNSAQNPPTEQKPDVAPVAPTVQVPIPPAEKPVGPQEKPVPPKKETDELQGVKAKPAMTDNKDNVKPAEIMNVDDGKQAEDNDKKKDEDKKNEDVEPAAPIIDNEDALDIAPDNDEDIQIAEIDKKPIETDVESEPINPASEMEGDSYFFTYFMIFCILFVAAYLGYHNKQKVLALILEGRRGKRQARNRRPNSANYHKLDSNLEEAITSSCKKNPTNV